MALQFFFRYTHTFQACSSIRSRAFATILNFLVIFPENSKFYFFPKIWKFGHFWIFWKITKMRAPKFHAEWSGFHAEISHMRPIQGQKLKLEIDHFPDPLKN